MPDGRMTSQRAAVSWEDVKMLLYEAGYREVQPGVFSRETDGRQLIVVPSKEPR